MDVHGEELQDLEQSTNRTPELDLLKIHGGEKTKEMRNKKNNN